MALDQLGAARDQVRMLAATRLAVGVAMLAAPRLSGKLWVGPVADDRTARVLVRGFGAREVALGLGALLALRKEAPVRGWVEAGVLCDATDAVLSATGKGMPALARVGVAVSAAGAAAMGARLAATVDEPA